MTGAPQDEQLHAPWVLSDSRPAEERGTRGDDVTLGSQALGQHVTYNIISFGCMHHAWLRQLHSAYVIKCEAYSISSFLLCCHSRL